MTTGTRASQLGLGALDRRWWALLVVLAHTALLVLPLIVAAVSRPLTDHGFVYELGRSFALVGLALLALQFVKVPLADAEPLLAEHRGTAVPTRVLFRNGDGVARRKGAQTADEILSWLDEQV